MKLAWARLDGRDGHAVAMELLRQLVGSLPPICRTPQSKPYFEGSDLHFSFSHTKTHAFCAVSQRNIGIDAEPVTRIPGPALAKILSEAEKARAEGPDDLLRLWVLKESYAKLTGRGIGNYLKNTDFNPNDPRITVIDGCYVAIMEEDENAV